MAWRSAALRLFVLFSIDLHIPAAFLISWISLGDPSLCCHVFSTTPSGFSICNGDEGFFGIQSISILTGWKTFIRPSEGRMHHAWQALHLLIIQSCSMSPNWRSGAHLQWAQACSHHEIPVNCHTWWHHSAPVRTFCRELPWFMPFWEVWHCSNSSDIYMWKGPTTASWPCLEILPTLWVILCSGHSIQQASLMSRSFSMNVCLRSGLALSGVV